MLVPEHSVRWTAHRLGIPSHRLCRCSNDPRNRHLTHADQPADLSLAQSAPIVRVHPGQPVLDLGLLRHRGSRPSGHGQPCDPAAAPAVAAKLDDLPIHPYLLPCPLPRSMRGADLLDSESQSHRH